MARIILSVLGVLLAVWLVFQLVGLIIATVKFFLVVAVLVFIVVLVVTFVSRLSRD
jgi:hypothetical protein